MLNSEYRFPLFDNLLYGLMNPFLSSNSCEAFLLSDESLVSVRREANNGSFVLFYPKPPNAKCSFYYHRLTGETLSYCNDLLEELSKLDDSDVRAYLRLTILDSHLKTALIKTGEVLREYHLSTDDFLAPTPGTDTEKLSNSYIFHLLKVCLAKAYLEIQSILKPLSAKQLNEAYLYTGYAGETPPVKSWLRKKKIDEDVQTPSHPTPVKMKTEVVSEEKPPALPEKFYTIKDLQEMGYGSERTLRRRLTAGEIKGFKDGNIWKFEESELKRYFAELKKPKPINK